MSTTTEVRERGIIFSAPMVRAILDGRKTQTRRVVKHQAHAQFLGGLGDDKNDPSNWGWRRDGNGSDEFCSLARHPELDYWARCPYGKLGDRLWVREAWRCSSGWDDTPGAKVFADAQIKYEVDGFVRPGVGDGCWGRYRHARFMPQKASRLALKITDVRVQRLQNISEADAIAEGCQCAGAPATLTNIGAYAKLWNTIHGDGAWEANPWVWVIEFEPVAAGWMVRRTG